MDDILRPYHLAPPLGETALSAGDVFLSLCELDEALLESVVAADEADVVHLENALGLSSTCVLSLTRPSMARMRTDVHPPSN